MEPNWMSANRMVGSAIHQVSRLRDHIERFDNGAVTAVDDMAVVLRLLLYSGPNPGNRLLARMIATVDVEVPQVWVSGPPSTDGGVILSVGSIPLLSEAVAGETGGALVPLIELQQLPLVNVMGTSYTLGEFLNQYANKWGGAHVDDDVPHHLQLLDRNSVGHMALGSYLVRMISNAVWLAAQKMFHELADKAGAKPEGMFTVGAPGGVDGFPRSLMSFPNPVVFTLGQELWQLHWLMADDEPKDVGVVAVGPLKMGIGFIPKAWTPPAPTQESPAEPSDEPSESFREPGYLRGREYVTLPGAEEPELRLGAVHIRMWRFVLDDDGGWTGDIERAPGRFLTRSLINDLPAPIPGADEDASDRR